MIVRYSIMMIGSLPLVLGNMLASAATCVDSIPESTPSSHFIIHQDATVTDETTGLMWKRCLEGVCDSEGELVADGTTRYSWTQAGALAENSSFAGYNDWRLPNAKELLSIVEYRCQRPSFNISIFQGSARTWTSTRVEWTSSSMDTSFGVYHTVDFGSGELSSAYKNNSDDHGVRLVRDGD